MFEVGQIQFIWSVGPVSEESQPLVRNLGHEFKAVHWDAKREVTVGIRHGDGFAGERVWREKTAKDKSLQNVYF